MSAVTIHSTAGAWPWEALKAHRGEWVEVSDEHWNYCLEVLPPIYFTGGFAVSEASFHDAHGRPVYLCLVSVNGKHYGREMAIADAAREARELRDQIEMPS